MTAALVPANPRLPIEYLGGGFEFYAGAVPWVTRIHGPIRPSQSSATIHSMPGSIIAVLPNAGVNGTTHLEDLVIITATGAETIHPTGDRFVVI
jgi:hypothetical protein